MRRSLALAAALVLAVPGQARASDAAILMEILVQNIIEVTQVAEQVNHAVTSVKLLRQQVDQARAVYEGIDELNDITWEDLGNDVRKGTFKALYRSFPGLEDVVEDFENYEEVFDPTTGSSSEESRRAIRGYVINAYGKIPGVGPSLSKQLLPEVASRQEIDFALQRARNNLSMSEEKYGAVLERLEQKASGEMSPGQAQIINAKAAIVQASQMKMMTETMSELLRLEALRLGNESNQRTRGINGTMKYLRDVSLMGSNREDHRVRRNNTQEQIGALDIEVEEGPSVDEVLREEVPLD